MDLKKFMKKTGVTKKKYVDKWIDDDLIPGAVRKDGVYSFPESARRPYRGGNLKAGLSADKIRAHIVKAAILRHHISANSCHMSAGEFSAMITDLANADLIQIRVEDGVTYYDSTQKTRDYAKKSLHELGRFVQDCLKSLAEGATTAAINASAVGK